MTPFLILSMARSGTQMLSSLLNQHLDVMSHGELLNPFDENMSDHDVAYLSWRRPDHAGLGAVGITVMDGHLDGRPFTLPYLLNYPGVRVIVLERANQLERLRSLAQAAELLRWDVSTPPPAGLPAVTLDPDATMTALRYATMWHRQLGAVPVPVLWMNYEGLVADPVCVMSSVWWFLGVSRLGDIPVDTYRQEQRGLDTSITNFEEISEAVSGTRYAWMVE